MTFDECYKNYHKLVYLVARKFVDHDDAEDIASSVFMDLWKKWEEVSSHENKNYRSYLLISTGNKCKNFIKLHCNKLKSSIDVFELELPEESLLIIEFETVTLIKDMIERLPAVRKKIFKDYIETGDQIEVAKRFGMNRSTVRSHIANARASIIAYLQREKVLG